jgi:hypothetical protein
MPDNPSQVATMKHVVSVSLGASSRDKTVQVEMAGVPVRIERRGTDGDFAKAVSLIESLSGKVDCIGLGGLDRYLTAGEKRWELRQAAQMVRAAGSTPVADGSGFKKWVEPAVLRTLGQRGELQMKGAKVLMVSGVDRYGMAQAFWEMGADVICGDLMFALGIPIPIRSLRLLNVLASLLLPFIRLAPIQMLYPTGEKQEVSSPRFQKHFLWADIIAGDFHFIRRHLPDALPGRTIVTNTTTEQDVELLGARGIARLVTTTPVMEGRSFGTNVLEACLVAISGKGPENLSEQDYLRFMEVLGWQPQVRHLESASNLPQAGN